MTGRIRDRAWCAFERRRCRSNKNRVTEVTLPMGNSIGIDLGNRFDAFHIHLKDAADCAAGADDVDVEGSVDLDGGTVVDVVGDLLAVGDRAGDEVLRLRGAAE